MAKQTTIVGEKALMKRLAGLASKASRNRIARPAIGAAASAINKKAKSIVVEESGLLRKSVGVKRGTNTGGPFAVVGPRHGFKQQVERTMPSGYRSYVMSDPTKYAHLIEFGTSHSSPQPFLRPAYDGTDSKGIIARRMQAGLRKQAQNRSGSFKADKGDVKALRGLDK